VKLPIFERLPNDFKQVSRAINMGTELVRGQNDQLVQKFRSLTEQITGTRREGTERKGAFLGLFSGKQ